MDSQTLHRLQFGCAVTIGADVALLVLWSYLNGVTPMFVTMLAGVGAYVTILQRATEQREGALLVKTARRIKEVLAGSSIRAAGLMVFGFSVLLLVLLLPTLAVVISVNDQGEPPRSEKAEVFFEVKIWQDGTEKETFTIGAGGHGRVRFSLMRVVLNVNALLSVEARHYEYEGSRVEAKLWKSVSKPLRLEPRARPALMVMVHEGNRAVAEPESYRVMGKEADEEWAAGSGEPLSADGVAKLVARRSSWWLVRIDEIEKTTGQRERWHRSDLLRVLDDATTKPYRVDLADREAFPWEDDQLAEPREPRRMAVSGDPFPWLIRIGGGGGRRDPEPPTVIGHGLDDDALVDPMAVVPHPGATLLVRDRYLASYNRVLKIPNWVMYRVAPGLAADVARPRFIPDPGLGQDGSTHADYLGSGFERGHLVSAADMAFVGETAVRQAYYLSVVAPQTTVLNRRTWLSIEKLARDHVSATGETINVMTGAAFQYGPPRREGERFGPSLGPGRSVLTIGEGVAVPTHFFRVHWNSERRPDVLSFLVPNDSDVDPDPTRYIVSLRSLQRYTGLSFFPPSYDYVQPDLDMIPNGFWEASGLTD